MRELVLALLTEGERELGTSGAGWSTCYPVSEVKIDWIKSWILPRGLQTDGESLRARSTHSCWLTSKGVRFVQPCTQQMTTSYRVQMCG